VDGSLEFNFIIFSPCFIFQAYHEVKAQVKSALSDNRHSFNSLPQRWFQHQQQQKKYENTLNALQVG